MTSTEKPVKDGTQRKRDFDLRKKEQGLVDFRAWVTPEERAKLWETLANFRQTAVQKSAER